MSHASAFWWMSKPLSNCQPDCQLDCQPDCQPDHHQTVTGLLPDCYHLLLDSHQTITRPSPDCHWTITTVTGSLPDRSWTVTGPLPDHHKTVSHIILQILTSYLIKMHCALRFECLKPNKKEASNVKCQPDDFLQRFWILPNQNALCFTVWMCKAW